MPDDTIPMTIPSLSANNNLPDLDECMRRLELISGLRGKGRIMRWLGLPEGSYSNWKRRGKVNYGKLAVGLLSQGKSLDWFCAL